MNICSCEGQRDPLLERSKVQHELEKQFDLYWRGDETAASHSPELCWSQQQEQLIHLTLGTSAMTRDVVCAVVLQLFVTVVLHIPAVTAKIPRWNIKVAHDQG